MEQLLISKTSIFEGKYAKMFFESSSTLISSQEISVLTLAIQIFIALIQLTTFILYIDVSFSFHCIFLDELDD